MNDWSFEEDKVLVQTLLILTLRIFPGNLSVYPFKYYFPQRIKGFKTLPTENGIALSWWLSMYISKKKCVFRRLRYTDFTKNCAARKLVFVWTIENQILSWVHSSDMVQDTLTLSFFPLCLSHYLRVRSLSSSCTNYSATGPSWWSCSLEVSTQPVSTVSRVEENLW